MGEGPRGSNGTCSTLCWISVTPCATHNQIGPLWCWFPSGWAVHAPGPCGSLPRPLLGGWESLLRPPQPPRTVRGLRLYFPALEPWVARSALLPAVCPVYLCANVWPWGATHCSACPVLRRSESGPLSLSVCECGAAGSASGQTACPFHPTLRLGHSWSCHGHSSPLRLCPSLPLLRV